MHWSARLPGVSVIVELQAERWEGRGEPQCKLPCEVEQPAGKGIKETENRIEEKRERERVREIERGEKREEKKKERGNGDLKHRVFLRMNLTSTKCLELRRTGNVDYES